MLRRAQKFIIQKSKFCRIDQVFCSSFYHESKSENLFLTKYYPKCPKISKERKKEQVARSLCPKATNYPTSPIPEKKTIPTIFADFFPCYTLDTNTFLIFIPKIEMALL
jgi:hypothetical protein